MVLKIGSIFAPLIIVTVAFSLLVESDSAMAVIPTAIDSHAGQETEMTFTSVLAGSGRTEDGSPFSFWSAKSSDGVAISARTEKRRSVARAHAELRKQLKSAEVVEQGPKTNNQGERVGERVVGCFAATHETKGRCVVLWTDGSDFHFLESQSLRHLLAFEKKYYSP